MKAKEYIKIVEDKRDLLAEIMIAGMKECDKKCWDGWYELYINLSADDLNPDWRYWSDPNSGKICCSNEFCVLTIGPRGSWTDWFDDIESAAGMLGVLDEDLISAARPWLESEEYIDSDDEIDISHIALWLQSNPDEPIVQELREALDRSIDCDYEDTYREWADLAIADLIYTLRQMERDEEEQEADRAAWERGEVW